MNIVQAIGCAVAECSITVLMACAATAPMPICTKPVMPDAVPAACGRTLIAPATALGRKMPLPQDRKNCAGNTVSGPPNGNACASAIERTAPKICNPMPARIMLSMPKRGDRRAAIRLPIM